MTTKQVGSEAQQLEELVLQANANVGAIANGLRAIATARNVTLTWDPGKVIADLGMLATAAATSASTQDQASGALRTGRSEGSSARDAQASTLFTTLRTTRAAIVAQYGEAAAAQVYPAGRLPRKPSALASYALQIAAALPQHAPGWTPLNAALNPLNVANAVQLITTQATALKAAVSAVGSHDGSQTSSSAALDADFSAMHDLHKGLLHVLVGFLEATGQDDLADRMTIHHHLAHARAAAPAEAAKP